MSGSHLRSKCEHAIDRFTLSPEDAQKHATEPSPLQWKDRISRARHAMAIRAVFELNKSLQARKDWIPVYPGMRYDLLREGFDFRDVGDLTASAKSYMKALVYASAQVQQLDSLVNKMYPCHFDDAGIFHIGSEQKYDDGCYTQVNEDEFEEGKCLKWVTEYAMPVCLIRPKSEGMYPAMKMYFYDRPVPENPVPENDPYDVVYCIGPDVPGRTRQGKTEEYGGQLCLVTTLKVRIGDMWVRFLCSYDHMITLLGFCSALIARNFLPKVLPEHDVTFAKSEQNVRYANALRLCMRAYDESSQELIQVLAAAARHPISALPDRICAFAEHIRKIARHWTALLDAAPADDVDVEAEMFNWLDINAALVLAKALENASDNRHRLMQEIVSICKDYYEAATAVDDISSADDKARFANSFVRLSMLPSITTNSNYYR